MSYWALLRICFIIQIGLFRTQLEQTDSPEYLIRKRRAEHIAQEIEDKDNRHCNEGEDRATTEEDKYSSVVRPNAM